MISKRVVLNVDHAPFGKARVNWAPGQAHRGGAFVDAKTKGALAAIRDAWRESKATMWPRGTPISLTVSCRFTRPGGHFRSDGLSLSKSGLEAGRFVQKKPDADNVAKTVMDALNTYAYHDDAQVVHLAIVKTWVNGPGAMIITLEEVADGTTQ